MELKDCVDDLLFYLEQNNLSKLKETLLNLKKNQNERKRKKEEQKLLENEMNKKTKCEDVGFGFFTMLPNILIMLILKMLDEGKEIFYFSITCKKARELVKKNHSKLYLPLIEKKFGGKIKKTNQN